MSVINSQRGTWCDSQCSQLKLILTFVISNAVTRNLLRKVFFSNPFGTFLFFLSFFLSSLFSLSLFFVPPRSGLWNSSKQYGAKTTSAATWHVPWAQNVSIMHLGPSPGQKRISGVFRAQETRLVAANVILLVLNEVWANAVISECTVCYRSLSLNFTWLFFLHFSGCINIQNTPLVNTAMAIAQPRAYLGGSGAFPQWPQIMVTTLVILPNCHVYTH